MNRKIVAIVAIAGIVGACAPVSKTPAGTATSGAPQMNPGPSAQRAAMSFAGIKKADQTVAEIYAGKDSLADTVVNVRGKVVKYNAQIMGKNWVHVQDGTGSSGTNDLMVTTAATANVGDIVLVTGKITLNKDFGSGYNYALILEDAQVLVEAK